MRINEFPEQVVEVLNRLIKEKETDSIWLVGSRANGTEHTDSDWDFIVFVSNQLSERTARHSQVDIIRVDRSGNYLLEGQPMEGFYPVSTDGLKAPEKALSRLATLRRIRGLWKRSI